MAARWGRRRKYSAFGALAGILLLFPLLPPSSRWSLRFSRKDELRISGSSSGLGSRVAFLFILPPCFVLEPIWMRWFQDEDPSTYGIVVHQQGLRLEEVNPDYSRIAFHGGDDWLRLPNVVFSPTVYDAMRFSRALARVSRVMLGEARRAFPDAECFVILSGTTAPLVTLSAMRQELFAADGGRCPSTIQVSRGDHPVDINTYDSENERSIPYKKASQWAILGKQEVDLITRESTSNFKAESVILSRDFYHGAPDEFYLPTLLHIIYNLPAYFHLKLPLPREEATAYTFKVSELPSTFQRYNLGKITGQAASKNGRDRPGGHPFTFHLSMLSTERLGQLRDLLPGAFFMRKFSVDSPGPELHYESEQEECRAKKEVAHDLTSNLKWS